MENKIIEIVNIQKSYQMGTNTVRALCGVSLTIESGDFVAIMGPSGSGKSTLMHILGLLDVPNSGSYKLIGEEVSQLNEDNLAVFRRKTIGFIFQQFNLLPRMSALENVSLPLLYSQRKLDVAKGEPFLDRVRLKSRMLHKPNELSGGQQQRIAIARALVNHPKIILADEPTGNLDSVSEKEIMTILKELNQQGITIIIVTHEEEIGQQAKRLIRMRDGEVQSDERLLSLYEGAFESKSESKSESEDKSKIESACATLNLFDDKKGINFSEIFEHFYQGFRTLAANKVRTGLSMLGILIGVGAVVAMLALGRGAQKAIETQLASLGSNLLVLRSAAIRMGGVSLEAGNSAHLTIEDAVDIKEKISTVSQTSPTVNGRVQITYLNKNWNTQVSGVATAYEKIRASSPEVGRFFTDEENQKRSRVALIGATVLREVFGGQNPIGELIKINKISFQVIGILPEKGATGFRDQDDVVVVPVLTAMHRLLGKDHIDSIDVEVSRSEDIDSTQESMLALMTARHKIPRSQQDAFQVMNMADLQKTLAQSSQTMAMLLSSIAAISLLVGGIGIMNIMLVSVTERTREIGLRKAIGAKRRDILSQFLAEAVVVTTVGGCVGIFLGWLITEVLSTFAGWTTSISLHSVLLSFFFSTFIGLVFGIYPARKAALLNPIDALRYE